MELSRQDEDRLLDALFDGDRAAAEELARFTHRIVFGYLLRLTSGNRDLAEDLCQETYRRAWASLATFQRRSRFSSWLCTIAYRLFLNWHERAPRHASLEDTPAVVATLVVGEPSPEVAAERSERDEALRRCVLELPEPLRSTITSHYWGEVSLPDIAALSGISAVGARKRLAKGLKTLRGLLARHRREEISS